LTLTSGQEAEEVIIDSVFTKQVLYQIKHTSWQEPLVIEIEYGGQYRLFWDRLCTRPRALVLGAGHISQPVVEMLTLIDYAVPLLMIA